MVQDSNHHILKVNCVSKTLNHVQVKTRASCFGLLIVGILLCHCIFSLGFVKYAIPLLHLTAFHKATGTSTLAPVALLLLLRQGGYLKIFCTGDSVLDISSNCKYAHCYSLT